MHNIDGLSPPPPLSTLRGGASMQKECHGYLEPEGSYLMLARVCVCVCLGTQSVCVGVCVHLCMARPQFDWLLITLQ